MKEVLHRNIDALSCSESKKQKASCKTKIKSKDQKQRSRARNKREGKKGMLKIAKFGGSSCASGEQFRKVKEIVMEDRDRHYIVVSAPGKRNDQDTKVTDLLLSLYDAVQNKSGAEEILEKIKNRFRDIISDLDLSLSLEADFQEMPEELLAKMNALAGEK